MSEIPFYKTANLQSWDVIDHQDDPGFFWQDKIAAYWPDAIEPPSVGGRGEATGHVAQFLHEGQVKVAYPTGTPSDALASSMYFLAQASRGVFEKQALLDIAGALKSARDAWGVRMPDGYVTSLASDMGKVASVEHDPAHRADAFVKRASEWSPAKRLEKSLEISAELEAHQKDASHMPYMDCGLNPEWERHIEKRRRILALAQNAPMYLSRLEKIRGGILNMDDFDAVAKTASLLEQLDVDSGIRNEWGRTILDPVDTLLAPFVKEAKWAKADLSKLDEYFDSDTLDQIKSDPDAVIPTLPMRQRKLVEEILGS